MISNNNRIFILVIIGFFFFSDLLVAQMLSVHEEKGIQESLKDNHEQAILHFNEAIKLNPNDFRAYELRAKSKAKLNKQEEAILDYTKSILRNEYNSLTHYHRGRSKYELQDYRGAIQDFTVAINKNPTKNQTHYEPFDTSNSQFSRNQIITPPNLFDYDHPYFFRGLSYFSTSKYKEAIKDFTKVIDLTPQNISDYYLPSLNNRGLARIQVGQKELGCLDLSKAGENGFSMAYEAIREFC